MIDALIHVTHEAVQKVGGIGSVLQGLVTAPPYADEVNRTIFLGPLNPGDEALLERSGGTVLYSSRVSVANGGTERLFDSVVALYNVDILFAKRPVESPEGEGKSSEVEVLLVDPTFLNPRTIQNFKGNLYDTFGLQSDRYEAAAEYELYLGIAEPGMAAVMALLGNEGPVCLLAHEFMGMPAALKALMAYPGRVATVFYAHEVSTARNLVEHSAGHDYMFYNVLKRALEEGLSVNDVFGDQSGYYRHALVERAHHCHGIFAVGDTVVDELRFLGEAFQRAPIERVYNGIPALKIPYAQRTECRERLKDYGERLTGIRPDTVLTHVARPVPSKALWRDLRVLEHLDPMLIDAGQTAVFYLLATLAGPRSPEDVLLMESGYGWPVDHRRGWPDLVGAEADLYDDIAQFNRQSKAVTAVLVNTFGWDRESCGTRMPEEMEMMDLRKGSDVEFGQSMYEPFGISQLEPLGFGAVCVVSRVCGCVGFVNAATVGLAGSDASAIGNVVLADYDSQEGADAIEVLRATTRLEWAAAERSRSAGVAAELYSRIPRNEKEREAMFKQGYDLAARMSWERVCEDQFLPGVKNALTQLS